ncbi:MAG TPA: hypothetical protein VFY71_12800 [Planctomycetota bacterium]|nr:hypothetical protein [Planctomycetota bacterium]
MRLRSLALLAALLPGLVAPAGMGWCTALCTLMRASHAAPTEHGCCDARDKAPAAPASGAQIKPPCTGCLVVASPKSDLQKHEAAAAAVSLAPPTAAPAVVLAPQAPLVHVRTLLLPPATAGPGAAPLPLRI